MSGPIAFPQPFSRDGKLLAVWRVGQLTVCEAASGKQVATLAAAPADRALVALAPDGASVVATCRDGSIGVWDVRTTRQRHALRGHGKPISCLAFSPDGTLLASGELEPPPATGRRNLTVRVWDIATGKELRRLEGHNRGLRPIKCGVRSVAFSPDNKTLAVAGFFAGVYLWDITSGKEQGRLGAEQAPYGEVVFTPDGKRLAACALETVQVWDVAAKKQVCHLPEAKDADEARLAFAPDGKTLATWGYDGSTFRFWDVGTGKPVHTTQGHRTSLVAVACSPDGRWLATGGREGELWLWDAASGKPMRRLSGASGLASILAFVPDGSVVAAAYLEPEGRDLVSRVWLWDVATGKQLPASFQLPGRLLSLTFQPDGKVLAAAGNRAGLRLWDVASGEELPSLPEGLTDLSCLAFSPDGRTFALGGFLAEDRDSLEQQGAIRLYDLGRNTLRLRIRGSQPLRRIAFSTDGAVLTVADAQVLRHHDAATGQLLGSARIAWKRPRGVVFSPDRKLAAAPEGSQIRVWEVATGREACSFADEKSYIDGCAFAVDGRRLFSAGGPGGAVAWDLFTPPALQGVPARRPEAAHLAGLWADLAEADPAIGYRALCLLAGSPREATELLGKQLAPQPHRNVRHIRTLITALDSERYEAREQGSRLLAGLGRFAEPELRQALATSASPEVRRRVRALLAALEKDPSLPLPELRQSRAIQLLEAIGSADTRRLLRRLAGGEPLAPLSRDARQALQRLERRAGKR